MGKWTTSLRRGALAMGLAAAALGAGARPLSAPPSAGVRGYTYTLIQTINGAPQGYRMAFDLATDKAGVIEAVIRTAEETQDGKTFHPVAVDARCRAAMHGSADSLARVRVWPQPGEPSKALGPDFLDLCAPAAVFFPLTDIINVAIIPVSHRFSVDKLRRTGDASPYDGFETAFERAGDRFKETSHGGEVRLVSRSADRAVIDWSSTPAELDLTNAANGQSVNMTGQETWAFRLTLDARTGALVEAHTTHDDLDIVAHMAGAAGAAGQKIKISRAVSIERR